MMRAALVLLCIARLFAAPDCATCHRKESLTQPATPMAHALQTAAQCAILKTHPRLTARIGGYTYSIRRENGASIYSVSDGQHSIEAPILWAFGLGAAGQTYIFKGPGGEYESRVSYYRAIDGLDLTIGAATQPPRTLEEAAGRLMNAADKRDCFGCHSTGLTPGVQCERCHAGSTAHAASRSPMPKLSALSTEDVSNLCGACHRTWAQIAANGPHGEVNVRFQPYRLTNSKCYDAADKRVACTACHNPHEHSVGDAAFYDAKCAACHSAAIRGAKLCRTATRNCVTCHMPKVELAGAHFAFTDHMIRIAKPGERYPD